MAKMITYRKIREEILPRIDNIEGHDKVLILESFFGVHTLVGDMYSYGRNPFITDLFCDLSNLCIAVDEVLKNEEKGEDIDLINISLPDKLSNILWRLNEIHKFLITLFENNNRTKFFLERNGINLEDYDK